MKGVHMSGWYEIHKSTDGQYFFLLKAGNAEVILTSERYQTKAGAQNGIASVQANSPLDERYDRKQSTNDKWYFNLKASNFEIIGTSQMYSSAQAREVGIASVKANGPTKTIKDFT